MQGESQNNETKEQTTYVGYTMANHKNYFIIENTFVYIPIKTHDSESRGQEEAGRTRRMSVLFTRSTAVKFVNTPH